MTNELVRLIKHSGIYGLGVVLSKSVGFFMIPVYTRFLSPKDYGTLELLDMLVFITTNFAAMGIYSAVFRFYALYESEKDRKEVIATALLYNAGVCVAFALGLFHWASPIARLLLGQATLAPFVRIVALTFLSSQLTEVPLAYWRAQGRSTLFVCVGLARTITGASTLAFFLAALKWGILGALYANLLANGIWGLALFGAVLAAVPWKIAKNKLEEMLHYGLPTLAWSLAGFILTFSDRLFLRYYATLSEVGVYALGYKLAAVVAILVNVPFNMAWQWQQFELAKRENAKALFARIETYLVMVATLVSLGVSVLARDLLRIMAPQSYEGAAYVVPLVALSYLLAAVQYVVVSGVYIQRTTSRLAVIAAITAVACLLLNYVLISRFHAMGAAGATALSFALQLLLSFRAGQRVYPIQYQYARNALVLSSATLVYFLSTLYKLPVAGSVALNLLLLLAFSAFILTLLDSEERRALQKAGTSLARQIRGLRLEEAASRR
jgi:O-antigen/teichoic acid export membrane protein